MNKKLKYFGTKKKLELTDFQKISIANYKRRFSTWQTKQLDYLTFSINLLFTISLAVAGFIIANQDNCLITDRIICNRYSLVRTVLFLLTASTTVGLIGLVCRLNDFRLTKNIVRTRQRTFELENDIKYQDYEPADKKKIESKRDNLIWWSNLLGTSTWILFYIQLALFCLAMWIFVISIG